MVTKPLLYMLLNLSSVSIYLFIYLSIYLFMYIMFMCKPGFNFGYYINVFLSRITGEAILQFLLL